MAITYLECDIEAMIYENKATIHERGFCRLLENTERQFRLPCGKIIDILTWQIDSEDNLKAIIIELKREEAGIEALIQLATYSSAFKFEVYNGFKSVDVSHVLCAPQIAGECWSLIMMGTKVLPIEYKFDYNGLNFEKTEDDRYCLSYYREVEPENRSSEENKTCEKLRRPYKELNQ